jgi:hypothetical protein
VIERATAAFFGGLSRLRGRRIFHPNGVGFEAELIPSADEPTGAELFDGTDPMPAVVRLSRSIGLPEALADPCGVAVRALDAYGPGRHQDFLMVSSSRGRMGRHLLLPSRGFADRPYSCLLPYRIGDELAVIGAEALDAGPGPSLAELRGRSRAEMSFVLGLAAPGGAWREVARLHLAERIPPEETEALAFDPFNCGGGIEPAGVLNQLRGPAYRGSQDGRPRPASERRADEGVHAAGVT